MLTIICKRFLRSRILAGAAIAYFSVGVALAADHGDTPLLVSVGRHDARITDLYAFTRDDRLVLVVCTDPAIPTDVTEYLFPSDLTLNIFVDNDSEVEFEDLDDLATFGGTVVEPRGISEDFVFRVTADEDGQPALMPRRVPPEGRSEIRFFPGLRDDPFIRAPRTGRNIAATVIELPLEAVLNGQDTLLIWATSKVPTILGRHVDFMGRALRSQFPENDRMNGLRPKHHELFLRVNPDVMIFNTALPAEFPNGRELADDVVDLVGDERVLSNDDPFPDSNDVPFLDEFPYLAPPH